MVGFRGAFLVNLFDFLLFVFDDAVFDDDLEVGLVAILEDDDCDEEVVAAAEVDVDELILSTLSSTDLF